MVIRSRALRSGVTLNLATPLTCAHHVLDQVNVLLVMTVNPGLGGQAYLKTVEAKLAEPRQLFPRIGCRL
jgi:ribulose-phosphate 3-epimerase